VLVLQETATLIPHRIIGNAVKATLLFETTEGGDISRLKRIS
jgi:hypothetical protein